VTFARNLGIVALIALVIVLIPGGGAGLEVFLAALSIAFFTAIALLGIRLYREHRFTLESLTDRQRIVLYGSIAAILWAFTAASRLFGYGGGGALLWVGLLAGASYGLFWVYRTSREY